MASPTKGDVKTGSVAIANAATDSAAIPVRGRRIIGLGFPTMTSGTISFKVKVNVDDTSQLLYDENGNLVTLGPATTGARAISHVPALAGMYEVIVVSSVAQGAARTIQYIVRD
jgi:hypothetical protein